MCNTRSMVQVSDPRLARLQAAKTDDGVAAPRVISRRQARGLESEEESADEAAASSEESEEEDEAVTARRMAVRERCHLCAKLQTYLLPILATAWALEWPG